MSSSHRTFRRTCNNNVDKTGSSSSGLFNECDESRTNFPSVGCRLTLPSISPRTSYNRTKFPRDIICNRCVYNMFAFLVCSCIKSKCITCMVYDRCDSYCFDFSSYYNILFQQFPIT